MSTVKNRLTRDEAAFAASQFRELFQNTYDRWEFAGSLRRSKAEVGDLEHVVQPKFGDVPSTDLFGTPTRVNLLFHRMDELVARGELTKHVYSNGLRWGDKYRGADQVFRGAPVMNEVFCADVDNWGSVLAIRTGPAELSQRLVVGLRRGGHRNKDGYVWRCEPCYQCRSGVKCDACDDTKLVPVKRVSVPDERTFFSLAGIPWSEPEYRQ